MRDIKFRVWDKDFNKMVMVHDARFVNGLMIGAKGVNWDSKTDLMQYTGLKDKNGVEIYEGDIVRIQETTVAQNEKQRLLMDADIRGYDEVGFVEYDAEGADYQINFGGEFVRGFTGDQVREVIGNIYENPELLKG